MANTYTQIHLQFIFAPRFRDSLILPSWENELYKYITGIVQKHKHKLLAINGMPDHVHILAGMNPKQSVSDLLKAVKGDSSEWINQQKFTPFRFEWQQGYGAFSYTKSHVAQVIKYINDQKEHHKKKTFLVNTFRYLKNLRYPFRMNIFSRSLNNNVSYLWHEGGWGESLLLPMFRT